jgi:hypothetical protein
MGDDYSKQAILAENDYDELRYPGPDSMAILKHDNQNSLDEKEEAEVTGSDNPFDESNTKLKSTISKLPNQQQPLNNTNTQKTKRPKKPTSEDEKYDPKTDNRVKNIFSIIQSQPEE